MEPAGATARIEVRKDGMDSLMHHGLTLVIAITPFFVCIVTEAGKGIVACPYTGPVGRNTCLRVRIPDGRLIAALLRICRIVIAQT